MVGPQSKEHKKIRAQLKAYQEKVKTFRALLANSAAGTDDGQPTQKVTAAIEKGGKDIKEVMKKGLRAQGNRGKNKNVIKTWTEPPRV